MKTFAISDQGRMRAENQDVFFHCTVGDGELLLVCDGMGGANAGHVASRLAGRVICGYLCGNVGPGDAVNHIRSVLQAAFMEANTALNKAAEEDSKLSGMGTTAVCAYVNKDKALFFNVGDSRAYLIRDGAIEQITTDHSLVGQMVRDGQLTADQAKHHPQRNVITRALGPEGQVEPDCFERALRPGDRLLLCSDGLYVMLDDETMLQIIDENHSEQAACEALVAAANDAGGHDNITVLLCTL